MISRHLITLLCLIGFWTVTASYATPFAGTSDIKIYAGGVAGLNALADPNNSVKFRKAGGGLYLHNNGWAALPPAQQRQILANFQNHPVAIELGFKEGPAPWANHLQTAYLNLRIQPTFVAANAFDGNNLPTPQTWIAYSKALRAAGLPASTLILPTFEYANFGPNVNTLTNNTVSRRTDFQEIIQSAGGLALDAPPGYALNREENYLAWIFDAIQWTHRQGLTVAWITSPHTYNDTYRADTDKFLGELAQHDAMPNIIVCENYADRMAADYSNIVGNEDQPENTLGVAWHLLAKHPY